MTLTQIKQDKVKLIDETIILLMNEYSDIVRKIQILDEKILEQKGKKALIQLSSDEIDCMVHQRAKMREHSDYLIDRIWLMSGHIDLREWDRNV